MPYMNHADAIAFLRGVHALLVREDDLSPENPRVNDTLGQLVTTLKAWQGSGFGGELADRPEAEALVTDLPRICAKAECEMEKWWARQILASECPGAQALAAFWYLDEYEALSLSETSLLGEDGASDFAFLGSGALPVTAILLAQRHPETRIACVDCDGEACELAERLIRLLGLAERIRVEECCAEGYGTEPETTVICASLLDAPSLYDRLHTQQTQRLILRDAEGPYRFCYRPARLPETGYVQRGKSPLSAERINTSRYFTLATCAVAVDGSGQSADMLS